ncbi:C-type lectin domain family 4 member F [Tenrec ecaudatus]|uniref:C-type lectin domain family 4 member F n=1 Tax=Tenrec ecaudatus TaxID=94439 RepID=UPI003F597771
MKEAAANGTHASFCTDSQCVSLHPRGMESAAATPAAPKVPRLAQAMLAFVAMTLVFFLAALFVVAEDPSLQPFQAAVGGDNITGSCPFDSCVHFHHPGPYPSRVAAVQEALQMLKVQMENTSTWRVEIQMLKCSVDNVSSQIQMLSGHLEHANADIQMVKGELTDASTLSVQTQKLRSSLDGANAEIQRLKGELEKTNALNSQTQSFLKSSSESTSLELHTLSRGLENASTDIQMLKAGLEMANAQTLLANSSLKDVSAQIILLRGDLNSVEALRTQSQTFRTTLERATAEILKLKGGLQSAGAANSQTQTLVRGSLEKTSAEIQVLKGNLERAGGEIQVMRTDLERATAQGQMANSSLKQINAEVQALKAELKVANALNSQMPVLNENLKNANKEIQVLKRGLQDGAALKTQVQTLGGSLQKANAEIQRLQGDLQNTRTLTTRIQEKQNQLETLRSGFASLEQLQRTQNELLKLILNGWKVYNRHLYYFSDDKKSWHGAEQFCVSQGAHLASVTSAGEQKFLTMSTSTSYHWIGLTDRGREGSWRWVDGTPFNAAQSTGFWGPNQPDNWKHNNGQTEDCVHVEKKWNDMDCDTPYQWVCKKPVGQGLA